MGLCLTGNDMKRKREKSANDSLEEHLKSRKRDVKSVLSVDSSAEVRS